MKTSKFIWWAGLIVALLSAAISYCSCTAGITIGKSNRIEQTVTNQADSVVTTFSIIPNQR